MPLPEQLEAILFDPTTGKVLAAVVGVLIIYGVRRFIGRTLTSRVSDNTARYRTRKLVEFASYLVMALVIATVFSDQLGGFTVAFGVAGAGVAFALQEVIASAAGWVAITFAGFYKIGDRVMLGGIKGDVIDIGVLRTTVFEIGEWVAGDLYNGRVVRLANSFVFKEPVVNYSADFPFLWDEITVPLRHGSDRAKAQEILEGAATQITGEYASQVQSTWDKMTRDFVIEHARIQPMVTVVADENWLTYTVRYVTDFKARRITKDKLFRHILDALDATEGTVSLASGAQEITLMPPSVVDVSLREPRSA
ncbi:MAG: mechanosensitive ion channel family protein [Nannocystaceae bacterium]|nr:mechanosensitive ion channel family protein [bacterium]